MRVLVWTGSDIVAPLVEIVVRDEGLEPVLVSQLDAARCAIALGACDVVVSDLHMGSGRAGRRLMEEIDRIPPDDRPAVIPLPFSESRSSAELATGRGGPIDLRALRVALRATTAWSRRARVAC